MYVCMYDPKTILLIDTDLNLLKKNCIKFYLAL